MNHRTTSLARPRHLGLVIALAGLAALLGFTLSMGQVRAEDPDAEASLGLTLELESSGGSSGTLDGLVDTVIDDVDACVLCDDAVTEAHLTGGEILNGTQADACIIGDCVGGDSTDVLHSTLVSGEDSFVADTRVEICVLADCYPDESSAGRILVNSQSNDLLGDTTADICILGDCSGNGDLDGVIGTIATAPGVTDDTSVDGAVCILATCDGADSGTDSDTTDGTSVDVEVCILADCDHSDANSADDGTNETGEQPISNETPPGAGGPTDDDSDVPFGDPVGDPTTGGSDDSAANQDPSGNEQSGSSQQGLPLAGFGPMADMAGGYALPLTALFLLGAAWVAGAYLIRRHG